MSEIKAGDIVIWDLSNTKDQVTTMTRRARHGDGPFIVTSAGDAILKVSKLSGERFSSQQTAEFYRYRLKHDVFLQAVKESHEEKER